jgi:tetratricopeptide (TPR) repeat protein
LNREVKAMKTVKNMKIIRRTAAGAALFMLLTLLHAPAPASENWMDCSTGGLDKKGADEIAAKADSAKDLELAFKAGAVYASIPDPDKAKKYLGLVLTEDKDNVRGLASKAVYVLGKCLFMKMQNFAAASDQLEQIKKYFPSSPEARGINVLLATAYLKAKREGQAVMMLRKAIAASPNEETPYLEYAKFSSINGYKLEDGLQNAQKATGLNPSNAGAWAVQAEIQSALGKHADALKSAEEAAKLDPANAACREVAEKSRKALGEAKPAQNPEQKK